MKDQLIEIIAIEIAAKENAAEIEVFLLQDHSNPVIDNAQVIQKQEIKIDSVVTVTKNSSEQYKIAYASYMIFIRNMYCS